MSLLVCCSRPCLRSRGSGPLVTEDPEVIGPGRILIEGGLDLERDVFYPLVGCEAIVSLSPPSASTSA